MNLTTQIAAEDRRHERATERFKVELTRLMNKLPDNPRIKRLSPQSFVIFSRDTTITWKDPETGKVIGTWSQWGAESHDFKAQYRVLLGLLDNVSLTQGLKRIREALDKKSVLLRGDACSYTFPFHPDVISNVRGLLTSV